jgi:hypothetical protein
LADLSKILAFLEHGVQFAEKAAPVLGELTPLGALASTVINAVGAVTETVANVQQQISDGKIVANSTDASQVRDMAQRLHDANDVLAKQVDDS